VISTKSNADEETVRIRPGERRRKVDFENPRTKRIVDEDVEAEQLCTPQSRPISDGNNYTAKMQKSQTSTAKEMSRYC